MRLKTAISLALLSSTSTAVLAQPDSASSERAFSLEEIVVTAQRRTERLVDVPISMNSISQEEMEIKRIDSIFDLGKSVTSLRFEGQAPSFQPTLRGVGTLVQGGGVDASVAVYMDGVYLPNTFGMNFDFPNVANVQVLKGPQGTLFGRNATGGAILITTTEPGDEATGRFKVSYGRFDDKRVQGYLSGPLNDRISAGLSVNFRTATGFADNLARNTDNDSRVLMRNIRPDIKFEVTDDLSLRLIYEHSDAFDTSTLGLVNPDGYALANLVPGAVVGSRRGEFSVDQRPVNDNEAESFTAILDWNLNDSMALKSVTNYREDSNIFRSDADMSNLPLLSVASDSEFETLSQEFVLSGNADALDWVAGVYYFESKAAEPDTSIFTFGSKQTVKSSVIDTEALAVFADATYEMSDGLFLTLGGRYSIEDKELRFIPFGVPPEVKQDDSWNSFTPRAVIRYQITPDSNVYASYSRGFKSGAFAGFPPDLVEPEEVDALELGFKRGGDMLDLNASVFYYDYKDFQVTTFDFSTGLGQTVNAKKQRNYGVEMEATFRPTENWRISAGVAYLEAEFRDFKNANIQVPNGAGQWVAAPMDASGTRVPRSPKWSGNLSSSYDIDLGSGVLQLAANVTTSSSFYNIMNEQFEEPGYAEVGANISFTTHDGHWRGELFGNNLTDRERSVQYQGGPFGTYTLYAPPRVIGASLAYSF